MPGVLNHNLAPAPGPDPAPGNKEAGEAKSKVRPDHSDL